MQPRILSANKSQVECELYDNHPLRLSDGKGRRVECIAGVLWITAYDSSSDIFLRPGESFIVPNGGLVLVEGIGRSRMHMVVVHTRQSAIRAFCGALASRGLGEVWREWRLRARGA